MALKHIRGRVAGDVSLQQTLKNLDPLTDNHPRSIEELEAKLPVNIELAVGLFEAGKITEAEYVFYCGFHIVDLHEKYHFDGLYDSELLEIVAKMEQIERSHGLTDNQYWLISDAPADYLHESKRYDAVL
jgi:hypothetical protein